MVACTYNPCRPRQEDHHRFEVSLDYKVRPDVRRAKRRQSYLRKTSLWDPTSSLDKGAHGFTAVIGLRGHQSGQGVGSVGGQGQVNTLWRLESRKTRHRPMQPRPAAATCQLCS